mgnify:CR=1 FL=1
MNYGYVELSRNEDIVTGRITNVGRDHTAKGNIALELIIRRKRLIIEV